MAKFRRRSGAIASIGLLSGMVQFFRDREASLPGKIFVVLVAAYVVWPVDFVPDVIPIFGWLDDLGAATVAFAYLARVSARYRTALGPRTPKTPKP
jgi:uncharacterized membrane protein YkvA (DUF1232 family)